MSAKLNMLGRSARSISVINNNDFERITLRFIFSSLSVLALIYLYLLGNMVINIVERKSLEVSARALEGEVGELELDYLSLSNKVDLPLSYSLGFKEIKPAFTTRKSLKVLGYSSKAIISQNDI